MTSATLTRGEVSNDATLVLELLRAAGGCVVDEEIEYQLRAAGHPCVDALAALSELGEHDLAICGDDGWSSVGPPPTPPAKRPSAAAPAGDDAVAEPRPGRHAKRDGDCALLLAAMANRPRSRRALALETGLTTGRVTQCLGWLQGAGAAHPTGDSARDWPDAPHTGPFSAVWSAGPAPEPDAESPSPVAAAGSGDDTAVVLLRALESFGVHAELLAVKAGPAVTRYELALLRGTRISRVRSLRADLAYMLAATDIRIIAPIPGRQAIGIEIPNCTRELVRLPDIVGDRPDGCSALTVWLGKDVEGDIVSLDLATTPHLLVAGTTGAGKSVSLNVMLTSILLGATPAEVRVLLVDTKRVEMLHYAGIPHLLAPVIHDAGAATRALEDLVLEMERRYTEMSEARVRNLEHLNAARVADGRPALPRIVCFIDEFADLMLHAADEVELAVVELAQKARAIGIHLVVATQSPRADVITGIIKANVPARASFAVASGLESRIILDCNGAELLGGQGDMLLRLTGCDPRRLQGALVTEAEIAEVVARAMTQAAPVDDQPNDDTASGEHDAATAAALDDAAPADVPDGEASADPPVIPQPAACCDADDDEDRCAACASAATPTAVAVGPPAAAHDVAVARVLDAAAGLGDLLTHADAQAVADGAVEILRGHYLAALLNAIEHGNVDAGLLDRFERLCGFDPLT
jgi:hypothetical protein